MNEKFELILCDNFYAKLAVELGLNQKEFEINNYNEAEVIKCLDEKIFFKKL